MRAGIAVLALFAVIRPVPAEPPAPADALRRGVAYLVKHQSADGAWRSDVYATFKDGPALTPLAVCALQDAGLPDARAAARKGSEYLAKLVKPDGTIDGGDGGLDYPVYTAALSVIALSHPSNADLKPARDAWLKYLLDRQLTERHGWSPADKEYGGWGYCRLVPTKPKPGELAPPLVESNLSATVFALEACRAAGVADRAVYEKAAAFVRRCQNHDPRQRLLPPREGPAPPPVPPHLDGGFHFIYDDPVRNKAGSVEQPEGRPPAFHSYGSTTADGLRALRLCKLDADAPRVSEAVNWLWRNFKADAHPGKYAPQHERNRDAVYYYYAASVAKALRDTDLAAAPGAANANPPSPVKSRLDALAAELAKRQQPDGSWVNPVELVRENDPVVATCNAVTALAHCLAAK
jgi:squalene-hopene/tetraprenyl-beta-curcumene cyclase